MQHAQNNEQKRNDYDTFFFVNLFVNITWLLFPASKLIKNALNATNGKVNRKGGFQIVLKSTEIEVFNINTYLKFAAPHQDFL